MPFEKTLPEWNKTATAPTQTKKNTGWSAGEKPPASIFDWFFNTTFLALQELQQEAVNSDQKAAPNGIATLDATGDLPIGQADNILNWVKGFGLGDVAKTITGGDTNALDQTGFYYMDVTSTNQPVAATGFYIINIKYSATTAYQLAIHAGTPRMFVRRKSTTWGTWVEFAQYDSNGKVAVTNLPAATTAAAGIAQLVDSITSTAIDKAPTANAVKLLADWVKSYGLGDVAKDVSNTDLDLLDATGFYKGSGFTHAPNDNTTGFYFIINQKYSSTGQSQTAFKVISGIEIYQRIKSNGTWTSWVQVATTDKAQMAKLTKDDGTIISITPLDLNTVFLTGFYYYSGSTGSNGPIQQNGIVEIYQFSPTTALQVFTMMATATPRRWIRYGSGGTWGAWVEVAQYDSTGKIPVTNIPSAIKLTKDSGLAFDNAALGADITSFDQVTTAGFYYVGQGASGTGLANHPLGAGFTSNGFLLVWNNGTTYVNQQWTKVDGTVFIRVCYLGTWSAWKQLASTILEAWIAPTLINSWTSYSTYTAGYYKNNFGEVGFRGYLTGGVKTAGTVLFTLPSGYRPSTNLRIQALVSGGSAAATLLDVLTTGEVKLVFDISSYTYVALDGLTFRV